MEYKLSTDSTWTACVGTPELIVGNLDLQFGSLTEKEEENLEKGGKVEITFTGEAKDRLGAAVEGLFYQFVQKLCELVEVKYEDIFVDGTKIEAVANRYTFIWKKTVEKNEAKMLPKVQALVEEIVKVYHTELAVSKETINEDMAKMAAFLEKKKSDENIDFVHGNGKRKSNLQKLLEALYSYQERPYEKRSVKARLQC